MKRKYRLYGIIGLALILLGIGTFYSIRLITDKNKLTTDEKKWISDNLNNIQNINVIDDLDVFGLNGVGVFYDFIDDFSGKYNLKVNPITYKENELISGISFKKTNNYRKNDNLIYTDHYVVISKNMVNMPLIDDLANKKIGILGSDETRINAYFQTVEDVSLKSYVSMDELYSAINNNTDINYAIVPLNDNISEIIANDLYVLYHLSDLNVYYILDTDDSLFGSILNKYFITYKEDKLEKTIKENQYNLFVSALNLSSVEIDKINAEIYEYGFINQSPYEIIAGGNYGGIISYYISEFSSFSNLEFRFTKYKNFTQFKQAISEKEVDIYYNYYDLETPYATVPTLNYINYEVISSLKNELVLTSLNGLKNYDVYALNDSKIAAYLKDLGINVITYKDNKELFKLNHKDAIIVLDSHIYDYYQKDKLDKYTSRFSGVINDVYNFKIKDDDILFKLFYHYINIIDPNVAYNEGILNHTELLKTGLIYRSLAKYLSIIIVLWGLVWLVSYRYRKKIKIAKRIKKDEKIRYIDQLTLLKNRNYFSENIASWNKNTIYPQGIVVIDLNRVHEINDTLGYEKGDKQIKAAANILIKTQLDNSEIIRTDGNEFMVYCVGYSEKQIVSYIRKLHKEFKYLPYEYGATIGKSFITSELKSVDDALNEAIDDMKNLKEENK